MGTHRFSVPPEEALSTLAGASAALSALFALEAHMEQHMEWLQRTAVGLGMRPQRDDAPAKDARAKMNMRLDYTRALRTDLAELAADAEAVLPADVSRENEIVREPQLPELPDSFGPVELRRFERSFATGMGTHMREATAALRPLRDRMRHWDDPASRDLAEAAHEFIAAVHGAERA